jgi:hypothetical protein
MAVKTVASAGDHGRQIERLIAGQQDAGSLGGMPLDLGPFHVGQLARLEQHLPRHPHLSQVVQQPSDADRPNLGGPQLQRLAEGHRQHRDVHRVGRRVLIELLEL